MPDKNPATVARAHRYALLLTPAQEAAVARQEHHQRVLWNRLVNWLNCAQRDWRHGRRTALLAEMMALLSNKKAVGVAVIKARKTATEAGVTVEQALHQNRSQQVAKMQKYGRRRLGRDLAIERLTQKAVHFYGGMRCLLYGQLQKFAKSTENWLRLIGTAQAPNYKRPQDSVALQYQVTAASSASVGPVSDLSRMIGQAGKYCQTVWHRELPAGAVIKQLAIAGRPGRRFLVIMFNCPRVSVLKPFAPSESIVGVDTGYCLALTAVRLDDKAAPPKEYQPLLTRDRRFLKHQRRTQRRLDRQRRKANPECFNPNGTWKKGAVAKIVTKGMLKTRQEIQVDHERVADVRREHYHTTAFRILEAHGTINIGKWRPTVDSKADLAARRAGQPVPKTKYRRNRNRKGYDHAISLFNAIIKDKAALAATTRTVNDVEEAWTTQTCAKCRKLTGPVGPTAVKEWTCSACGSVNHRKGNNADNIGERGAK